MEDPSEEPKAICRKCGQVITLGSVHGDDVWVTGVGLAGPDNFLCPDGTRIHPLHDPNEDEL